MMVKLIKRIFHSISGGSDTEPAVPTPEQQALDDVQQQIRRELDILRLRRQRDYYRE